MTWQGIIGHDDVVERFRTSVERGRCAGSFLFIGPSGIGKRSFAFAIGKGLLCQTYGPEVLDACGECESCRLFGLGPVGSFQVNHPDFHYVCKPPEKTFLPLELLIGDKDHRGRSGLCYEISRTPFMGGRKIAIIDDADYLNPEGTNSLLKTLEEPPANSIMILIGTNTARQLPTIRSRCQLIRFQTLSKADLAEVLLKSQTVDSPEQAKRLAERSKGTLESALQAKDMELDSFRADLRDILSDPRVDTLAMAKRLNGFIEEAGKEAQPRRARLRAILSLMLEILRTMLPEPNHDPAQIAKKLERTLDAMEQVDRNANIPFILEAWMYDMLKA